MSDAPVLLSWLVLERGCGLPVDRVGDGDGRGALMPGIFMPGMLSPEDELLGMSDTRGKEDEACSQLVEEGRARFEAGCVDQGCMNWFPCHWLKGCPASGEEP